jgi:hypothetical protein
MASNKGQHAVTLAIPAEVYVALVDFCIEFLRLDDVPDEETLGSVAAYILGTGMHALEHGALSEPVTEDFAS